MQDVWEGCWQVEKDFGSWVYVNRFKSVFT